MVPLSLFMKCHQFQQNKRHASHFLGLTIFPYFSSFFPFPSIFSTFYLTNYKHVPNKYSSILKLQKINLNCLKFFDFSSVFIFSLTGKCSPNFSGFPVFPVNVGTMKKDRNNTTMHNAFYSAINPIRPKYFRPFRLITMQTLLIANS